MNPSDGKSTEKPVDKKKRRKTNVSNNEFAKITYAFVGLFLCMIGYIVHFQVVKSDDIISSSYNPRQDLMIEEVVRGEIQDRNGIVLAETIVDEDGNEERNYPFSEVFAHLVGYVDVNKSGIELSENFSLLTSNSFYLENIYNEFQYEKDIGDNLITTLDREMQQVA